MSSSQESKLRIVVAEQAAEWFAEHDEGPLDAARSAALVAWLRSSPMHVEEFLRVSVIARDFDVAAAGLGPVATLVARAHAEDDRPMRRTWSRAIEAVRRIAAPRWQLAASVVAAVGALTLGILWLSKPGIVATQPPAEGTVALELATRHGELQTRVLPDHSVLHLNTDTSLSVRYTRTERLIILASGEAYFEVAHETQRAFRVVGGAAEAVAHGTRFDVRVQDSGTVITVVEGRVGVAPAAMSLGASTVQQRVPEPVEVHADQQISVAKGRWPVAPTPVDSRRATAWLQRQISFDQEPLKRVVAELNRYADKPIEIRSPELEKLVISATFSTDSTDEFLAFLRSLDGVRVDVTPTRIVVSQK